MAPKEFDEFFSCAGGECIDGVRNDIRVDGFGVYRTIAGVKSE
jgi:hypothetical protein